MYMNTFRTHLKSLKAYLFKKDVIDFVLKLKLKWPYNLLC